MEEHPIRVVVADDRARSRLTVFFRPLLAIPHVVWLILWSIAAYLAAVPTWLATLVAGTPPEPLHRFLSAYVRYSTHVFAYLFLAAGPFPGFTGTPGYPVDLEIEGPRPQSRWTAGFRLLLAVPALLLAGALFGSFAGGGGRGGRASSYGFFYTTGIAATVAVLAWFVCLARARMPLGFRDLLAYVLRYQAQATGYLFLLTDRYPDSDPGVPRSAEPAPPRAVRLTVDDDLRRSRLTVFLRLLLALPHLVWLALWSVAALFALLANWVATLVRGRSPEPLHRFLAAYLRYETHVFAFVQLVANPFPGFTGRAGSYPVDLEIDSPERQNRWVTGFRILLAIPSLIVTDAVVLASFVGSLLGWFASLATGRMPRGLRNLAAYALGYSAQAYGYLYLLTARYPFSGPASPDAPVSGSGEPAVAPTA